MATHHITLVTAQSHSSHNNNPGTRKLKAEDTHKFAPLTAAFGRNLQRWYDKHRHQTLLRPDFIKVVVKTYYQSFWTRWSGKQVPSSDSQAQKPFIDLGIVTSFDSPGQPFQSNLELLTRPTAVKPSKKRPFTPPPSTRSTPRKRQPTSSTSSKCGMGPGPLAFVE